MDGYGDVVVAPEKGSVQPVVAISGLTNIPLWSYSPFGVSYSGGISVALGDVNGDGLLDLVSGQESTGSKVQVNLNNNAGGIVTNTIYRTIAAAMPSGYNGGVNVAAGNLNGSKTADIIVGSNASIGKQSQVQVFKGGTNGGILYTFTPFGGFTGGVRVGTENLNGSEDILITPASTLGLLGSPKMLVLKGNLAGAFTETLTDSAFQGGVFVG